MQRALLVTVASATVASAFVTTPITRVHTIVRSSEPNGMGPIDLLFTNLLWHYCIHSWRPLSADSAFVLYFSTLSYEADVKAESTEPAVAESAAAEAAPAEPAPVAPPVVLLNGWAPNPELACFGLPGALAPTGYFDPLGFAQPGIGLNDVKRNRESEVKIPSSSRTCFTLICLTEFCPKIRSTTLLPLASLPLHDCR